MIHIEGSPGRAMPREHVATRLRRLLGRLPIQPVTAHVTFSDVNGPKGGNDICCTVLVELPHRPSIRVALRGPTPRLAFDVSYDRVVRQLERYRERWQDSQRRPKKYFAARRLL